MKTAIKTEFICVKPRTSLAQDRFDNCMDRLHSCRVIKRYQVKILIESIRAYRSQKLSHGDLSEYNILNVREKPCIIDVGQTVPEGHPMYEELHERDMKNMYRYWKKRVKDLKKEEFHE